MSEVNILSITKDDMINILDFYYKYNGKKVTVREKHSIELRSIYEIETAEVKFSYEEECFLGGSKIKRTVILDDEDIKEALDFFLRKKGFEVKSILYKKGIKTNGRTGKEAYFNGIDVTIEKKAPVLTYVKK